MLRQKIHKPERVKSTKDSVIQCELLLISSGNVPSCAIQAPVNQINQNSSQDSANLDIFNSNNISAFASHANLVPSDSLNSLHNQQPKISGEVVRAKVASFELPQNSPIPKSSQNCSYLNETAPVQPLDRLEHTQNCKNNLRKRAASQQQTGSSGSNNVKNIVKNYLSNSNDNQASVGVEQTNLTSKSYKSNLSKNTSDISDFENIESSQPNPIKPTTNCNNPPIIDRLNSLSSKSSSDSSDSSITSDSSESSSSNSYFSSESDEVGSKTKPRSISRSPSQSPPPPIYLKPTDIREQKRRKKKSKTKLHVVSSHGNKANDFLHNNKQQSSTEQAGHKIIQSDVCESNTNSLSISQFGGEEGEDQNKIDLVSTGEDAKPAKPKRKHTRQSSYISEINFTQRRESKDQRENNKSISIKSNLSNSLQHNNRQSDFSSLDALSDVNMDSNLEDDIDVCSTEVAIMGNSNFNNHGSQLGEEIKNFQGQEGILSELQMASDTGYLGGME